MAIQLTTLENNIQFIQVDGRLDHSQTNTLAAQLDEALARQAPQIIIDLGQAEYINSGGLRTLVTGWRKAKQQGGALVLCGLNDRLLDIFSMVGFDKVFNILPDADAAEQILTTEAE